MLMILMKMCNLNNKLMHMLNKTNQWKKEDLKQLSLKASRWVFRKLIMLKRQQVRDIQAQSEEE